MRPWECDVTYGGILSPLVFVLPLCAVPLLLSPLHHDIPHRSVVAPFPSTTLRSLRIIAKRTEESYRCLG